MKKTTLIKTMFLLCALVVGSSNLWADDVNVLNENFSSNNTKSKLENAGWTISNTTSHGTGYLQIASGSGAGSATTPAFATLLGTEATLSVTHISSGKASRTLTITGVNCKVDGKSSTTVTVNGSGSSANTSTIAITEASTSSKITFSAASGQGTKINSVTVYYTNASSSPLASIALSGTYPTTFAVGDAFNHEGMTVTATYEDESTNNVTAKASFSGYNMSSTGTQEVTVSYTEGAVTKTAKYNITVKALANLAFSPASKNVALGSEEMISFSKSTDADVDFDVEDETIATYDPLTGKVRGLKEGTTKITATSDATSSYTAGSATCTIKVLDPGWIDLTAQGYDNADDVTTVDGSNGTLTFAIGTNKSNNPKWYDSGSAVRLYTGNTLKITAKTGFLLTDLEFSVTSGSMSKDNFSATVTNSGNKFTLSTPSNEITYSTASNYRIDKVKVNIAAPVAISAAEYATYCNATKALDFSETGITVYTATDGETKVTLNEITSGKLPANTPVVLYKAGADGTAINVPVIASADAVGDNDLRVSTGTDVDYMYVLAKPAEKSVGFYPWGGTTDLSAGKVYLQAKASYGARAFLGFNDDVTAIEAVKAQNVVKGEYFNLAGQRVAQPTKGLYIVNGRKVVMK